MKILLNLFFFNETQKTLFHYENRRRIVSKR